MATMKVDPDAHAILAKIKTELKARGRTASTFSDAIRYMAHSRAQLLRDQHKVG